MRIKLLALDIDGTLLNSQHQLTDRTIESVRRVVAAGIKVVLVTGRRFHAARPIAEELELDLPLITHNGALIKDAATLDVFHSLPLDLELSRELVLLGREQQTDTLCCDDTAGEGFLVFDRISEENVRLRAYIALFSQYAREVEDLHGYLISPPIQVFYVGPCARMDQLAEILNKRVAGRAKMVMTTYRAADMAILDVINLACSKGAGLSRLADSLGIKREEVMAVGDNHNDLEMLEYAGLPVIMANAEAVLRERGFATTASNDEDGVAVAIEQYIFSK
jgi:Cof subfamily protein (haloacid dehalogenase superfamily)